MPSSSAIGDPGLDVEEQQLQAELAGSREEAAALQQQLQEASAAREELAAAQLAVQELESDLTAKADDAAALREQLEAAVGGQQQAADLAGELSALQQQYAEQQAAAEAAAGRAAAAEQQVAEVQQALAGRDADVQALQEQLESLRASSEGAAAAAAQAEALQQQAAELARQVMEQQAALAAAEQEKGHYAGELETLIEQTEVMMAEKAQVCRGAGLRYVRLGGYVGLVAEAGLDGWMDAHSCWGPLGPGKCGSCIGVQDCGQPSHQTELTSLPTVLPDPCCSWISSESRWLPSWRRPAAAARSYRCVCQCTAVWAHPCCPVLQATPCILLDEQ